MIELKPHHILAIARMLLVVTLASTLLVMAARGQDLGQPPEPDWRTPFVAPGTSFTGGVLDVYRQPDGSPGFGVETGGGYVYRDRQGGTFCTDTSGLVTCLGSPDPDPAGFLDERR